VIDKYSAEADGIMTKTKPFYFLSKQNKQYAYNWTLRGVVAVEKQ
jgi:hypothetical protein